MLAVFANDPKVTRALLQWRGRQLFPTDLGSRDLRGFSRDLMQRSVVSARMTNAEAVQELADVVDALLAGKINLAEARYRMMRKLKELGYDPAVGFPQDMALIPPAEAGSLRDLSSVRRLNLMLETNLRTAANYGRWMDGNSETSRRLYPAWELVRIFTREVPRGSAESHSAGWLRRWQGAGESVGWEGALENKLVALKDSPIWLALGEGEGGYADTLGNPYPPFAFNSGMGWREVNREECEKLGLIENDETPAATQARLAYQDGDLEKSINRLSPDLKAVMERWLAA